MSKIYIIAIVLLILLSVFTSAATINAASCSYAAVLAAVNSAQTGDTVIVPSGSCTWNSQLVITKGINLIGAGIGQTIITGNVGNDAFIWSYKPTTPANNDPFRVSGFTFNCNNNSLSFLIYNTVATSQIDKIRVDHNAFTNTINGPNWVSFNIYGTVCGVFDNNAVSGQGYFHIYGLGKSSWDNLTFIYGDGNKFFLEDNSFVTDRTMVASQDGGRWVARHNTQTFTPASGDLSPWFDAHGPAPGIYYGNMGCEVYSNALTLTSTGSGVKAFHHRGGMALVYDNLITVASVNYAFIRFEQESDVRNSPTSGSNPQEIAQSYCWHNLNGAAQFTRDMVNDGGSYPTIVEDSSFWFNDDTFDGTSGVGVGVRSARPLTCKAGVGYWATDERILYKCTATNVWNKYYTPYTYPHPLRTDCIKYPTLCDSGLSPPVPPPVSVPGDLNNDSKVDISDLVIVATNFGKTSGFDSRANVVSSTPEVIDIADLSFVARRFIG